MTRHLLDGRGGLKSDLFRGIWPTEQYVLEIVLFYCFWVSREINLRFCSKTQWQMFLLVSGRHVGAHPDEHQHGVSIQISINLGGKASPHILHKKNCCDFSFGESLCIVAFFLVSDSGLNRLNSFDFYFDLFFEWRDTENQQCISSFDKNSPLWHSTFVFIPACNEVLN